jgi:hypothetical protein
LGKSHLENLGEDGRIILKHILKKFSWMVVDGLNLAQHRDEWRSCYA